MGWKADSLDLDVDDGCAVEGELVVKKGEKFVGLVRTEVEGDALFGVVVLGRG